MQSKTSGKLIKRIDQLPDWYPLAAYTDALTDLEWHHELVMRLAVRTAYRNTGDKQKALSTFQDLVVKSKYKSRNRSKGLLSGNQDLKRSWPVQELSAFDVAYVSALMSRTKKGNRILTSARRLNRLKRTHELAVKAPPRLAAARRRSFGSYISAGTERVSMSEVLHGVPLTVDVTQDDETLKFAFSVWLAGTRDVRGQAKRPIRAREFNEWKEYRILQVFDLDFWGQLKGLRYSDSLIARVLWPHAEVDAEERLRKVSRKKSEEVLGDWTLVSRFWRQLELEKFLDKVVKRNQSGKSDSSIAAKESRDRKGVSAERVPLPRRRICC